MKAVKWFSKAMTLGFVFFMALLLVNPENSLEFVAMIPFGAFAEIYTGVDGLIHISQVANKRIAKVEDELMIGQHVQAKVVEINLETKKIGLSIRALLEPEAPAEEAPVEEAPVEEAPVEEAPAEEAPAEEVQAPEVTEE